MGTVTELFDSRKFETGYGGTRGSRLFVLKLESGDDKDKRLSPDNGLPEIGDGAPGYPDALAQTYRELGRINDNSWFVEVIYSTAQYVLVGGDGGWFWFVQGAVTVDVATRTPKRFGRDRAGQSVSSQTDMGQIVYCPVDAADATHTTVPIKICASNKPPTPMYLKPVGGTMDANGIFSPDSPRKVEGMSVTKPAGTLIGQRQYTSEPNQNVLMINQNKLNSSVFRGAARWTLKLVRFSVSPTYISQGAGQPTETGQLVNYLVSVEWEWNPEGHQPNIVHTQEIPDDPPGGRAIIYRKGEEGIPIVEIFDYYDDIDAQSLMDSI